jgi:hypothetical protein
MDNYGAHDGLQRAKAELFAHPPIAIADCASDNF